MTEYWKSNPMYWCDVCKCWMNDTKAARLNHERGSKHQELLAKKIRDMTKRADAEKAQEKAAASAMENIEAAARKQYEADKKAAQELSGKWVWTPDSGYYYNAKHAWYYDHTTSFYYGGTPTPTWTQAPGLPSAAMFGAAPVEGGPAAAGLANTSGRAAGSTAPAANGSSTGATGGSQQQQHQQVKKKVMAIPAHPLASIGGHQMPVSGRIGGSKGVGTQSAADASKRKREDAASKHAPPARPEDPAEAAARARRDAARARVEGRTKAAFGLT